MRPRCARWRSRSWARRSDVKNIAFTCSVKSTLCSYMASRMARSRPSSSRRSSRGSGVIAAPLVPRFLNLGTAIPDGLDRSSMGARHPCGHHRPCAYESNCCVQHHLLPQALSEPAVVIADARGRAAGTSVERSAVVCRRSWRVEPLRSSQPRGRHLSCSQSRIGDSCRVDLLSSRISSPSAPG